MVATLASIRDDRLRVGRGTTRAEDPPGTPTLNLQLDYSMAFSTNSCQAFTEGNAWGPRWFWFVMMDSGLEGVP